MVGKLKFAAFPIVSEPEQVFLRIANAARHFLVGHVVLALGLAPHGSNALSVDKTKCSPPYPFDSAGIGIRIVETIVKKSPKLRRTNK